MKIFGENKVKKEFVAKDFRFCDNFLDDLIDGYFLAACIAMTGCANIDEFEKWLVRGIDGKEARTDWLGMVNRLISALFDSHSIQENRFDLETGKYQLSRKQKRGAARRTGAEDNPDPDDAELDNENETEWNGVDTRDVPFDAAVLMLRDGFMYRDFWDCKKKGDTGRLVENLHYW